MERTQAPPSVKAPCSLCERASVSLFFPEARVSNNVAAGQSWRGSSMPLVCHRRAVDPESARNQTTALDIVPFRATFDSKVLQSQANRDRQEQGTCRQEMRSLPLASACGSASDTLDLRALIMPSPLHLQLSARGCSCSTVSPCQPPLKAICQPPTTHPHPYICS